MKRSLSACLLLLAACSGGDESQPASPISFGFEFAQGAQQWTAGFADYPPGQESFYELVADYRALPAELGSGSALYISGNNHSDDLFMFYKRRLDGLVPGRVYRVRFDEVQIATSAPSGCVGVGGAPGEGVTMKAGASTVEPQPVIEGGSYRLNVDKGNQVNGGAAALALGHIANGRDCGTPVQYVLKSFDSGDGTIATAADAGGTLWVFAGTDSGFEATTSLYYTRFHVTLL